MTVTVVCYHSDVLIFPFGHKLVFACFAEEGVGPLAVLTVTGSALYATVAMVTMKSTFYFTAHKIFKIWY